MSDEMDSRWHTITRGLPDEVDFQTLLKLLNHADWSVRFNAARVLRFRPDAQALDVLMDLFEREKHSAVRHMVALALSALHESGVEVPLFARLKNPTAGTRRDLVINRLKEFGIRVSRDKKNNDQLLVPHKLDSGALIEVGFLMAQLTDIPFPENYSPIADQTASKVFPGWSNPTVEFVESYPHGMKFRIRRTQNSS